MGCDEHEGPHDEEPEVAQQKPRNDQGDGDPLAHPRAHPPAEACAQIWQPAWHPAPRAGDRRCLLRCPCVSAAKDTSAIQRKGGQKIDCAEQKIDPDHGAEQVRRRNPRPLQQVDAGRGGEHDGREQKAEADAGERANHGHTPLDHRLGGALGGFRRGVGHEAAGGQQQDSAQLQAEPSRGQRARHPPAWRRQKRAGARAPARARCSTRRTNRG